jgi:hypothetical protein
MHFDLNCKERGIQHLLFVWAAAVILVAVTLSPAPAAADPDPEPKALALRLIDRFYDGLAPGNSALAQFIGDGFQIIGSDGLRFDRNSYLAFPKQIRKYEITDIIARREGDVLTATFEVGYVGAFQGVARDVPRLARLAVFHKTDIGWKLQAFAALGTGENDVAAVVPRVLATWRAATASGDVQRIRALAAPNFQLQRPDGTGAVLEAYLKDVKATGTPADMEDLAASSFSNTMVIRYSLRMGSGKKIPGMTVFERINGIWLALAEVILQPTK